MAKRYTSTIQLHCGKQHTCSSCGCLYSYVLDRKIVGTAGSEAGAIANMQKNFAKAQREECDMHPCPNCGQYQQDMIGLRLARKRKIVAGLAIIMPILLPILRGTYAVQANTLTWIAFLYCAGMLALQFFLSVSDPNRDREANRGVAANRIVAGAMHVQPMTNAPELLKPDTPQLPRPTQSIGHRVVMLLLIGTALLAIAPELLRAVSKWPLNAACYPPVVGAADTTRVYMEDSIVSIKSYWRGAPVVSCDNPAGGAPIVFEATTNQNSWGDTINVDSNEKNNTSHPWVELTVPEIPDLAGQTITCHIHLTVEFPEVSGPASYQVAHKELDRDVTIQLAPAHAGSRYNGTWWMCTVVALLTIFVGSIVLFFVARSYQRQAKPTQIFSLKPA